MQKVVIILVCIAAIAAGCSVSRRTERTTDKTVGSKLGNTIEAIVQNNLTKTDFQIQRAEIRILENNNLVHFTATIKFKKPDSVLISVRSTAGFEVARVFFTRDTLLVIDRINKKLMAGSPEILGKKYGIDPELIFVVFGDIIVDEDDKKKVINCSKEYPGNDLELYGRNVSYLIDCDKKKTMSTILNNDSRTGNVILKFNDFASLGELKYPRKIEILNDTYSVNIMIHVRKIEGHWNGKIRFVSGTGFKFVKIR